VTRALRLFNKNTGDRKRENVSMVADSCPVAVSENRVQPDEGPLNGGGNYDPRQRGRSFGYMLEYLSIPHYSHFHPSSGNRDDG